MLKRLITIALLMACVLSSGFSSDTIPVLPDNAPAPSFGDFSAEGMELTAALSASDFPDTDSYMAYMFLLSYAGLMNREGQGGLVCYNSKGGWITSWRMDGTPEDFLIRMPRSTLVIPQVFPAPVASVLFASIGDLASSRAIEGATTPEEAVIVFSVWKIYGETILRDPVYTLSEMVIDSRIYAHGLEPSDFFASYKEATGISEEEFITSAKDSRLSADQVIEDAMSIIQRHEMETETRTFLYILIGISISVVFITVLMIFLSLSVRKRLSDYNTGEDENGNDENTGDAKEGKHAELNTDEQENGLRNH